MFQNAVKFLKQRPRLILFVSVLMAPMLLHFVLFSSPARFPVGRVITIESGWSVNEVAQELKRLKVIKSTLLFKTAVSIGADGNVIAGDYIFAQKRNLVAVAKRFAGGDYGLEASKVRVVEGSTVNEIASVIASQFPKFDSQEFVRLSSDKEGFLFPDTYHFLPNIKPVDALDVMEENFYKKVEDLQDQVSDMGRSLKEVITMASLLEKEAFDHETRRMISGILWKRLEIGMPLQVDAVFLYINGKNTYELSLSDLRENDSPYNTYKYKGLPPGPIGSPSLDSILAAVNPVESDYLFYLADRDGNTYYARTFEEHKAYKNMYVY